MPPEEPSFEDRLQAVENRIQRALQSSGRKRPDITLVAVTKKFSAARIREGYEAGLRHFGENYVREFAGKLPELQGLSEARFHLIGHLQSNKARLASQIFHTIQTVDSSKLLERLDAVAAELDRSMAILFEIKLSEEQSKTGADPDTLPKLMDTAVKCKRVHVSGLMTVPPWSEDAEQSRPYFRRLAALAKQYGLRELSMGMSGDFEVAIEEGATMVRVGTALFGPRPKPAGLAPGAAQGDAPQKN
ncbi:MAG TPA: YggS family pyridoxal phosphate-dependent enzyme [Bryobacteraceae bacterium]|nr:YggS family pyridoxal phosphate-dependent enzyme [Bryobacteraceae bacterium]